jgi:putative transposase
MVRMEGLSVRLDPTNAERSVLARAAGARRHCFNFAVAAIRDNHVAWKAQEEAGLEPAERVRPLSAIDLESRWRRERPAWAGEVSSWVFSFACRDAAQASRNFLAGRSRFPRFARKGRTRERFTIAGRDVRLEASWVTLPKVGRLRLAGACPAQARLRRLVRRGRARLLSGTVSRHADGSWWLSFKVERQVTRPAEHPSAGGPVVGVDRGVKVPAVAATADAVKVGELAGGRRRRTAERALRRAQRRASRRYQRGRRIEQQSAGWREAQARVGRLHAKVARQRAGDLHAFTRSLTEVHATFVVETLTTRNLMANRHLAGAIADQGWGELARQLAYKAERRGGRLLAAPRTFPSSKTCACCGWVKPKLRLDERTYHCDRCGHVADRDQNAAATLAAWGEHTLGRCPCVTQARDPNPSGRSGTRTFHACGGWESTDNPAHSGGVAVVPSDEAGASRQPSAA